LPYRLGGHGRERTQLLKVKTDPGLLGSVKDERGTQGPSEVKGFEGEALEKRKKADSRCLSDGSSPAHFSGRDGES